MSSVRRPEDTVAVVKRDFTHSEANVRILALRRYHALWRNRFHVWLKMEDGAQLVFKVTTTISFYLVNSLSSNIQ